METISIQYKANDRIYMCVCVCVCVCVCLCMYGWVGGWMDGWMDGQTDIYQCTDTCRRLNSFWPHKCDLKPLLRLEPRAGASRDFLRFSIAPL